MAYHRAHGVDTRIVRIFNTYGERMRPRDGRVVPALIGQALAGEPMTVFGDGSQTRSFCYVSDLVDGIYRLLQSDDRRPGQHRQPGRAHRPRVRADDPRRSPAPRARSSSSRCPVDDPKVRQPDITKAQEKLGWEPKVTLEEGLTRTIEYFRRRLVSRAASATPRRSPIASTGQESMASWHCASSSASLGLAEDVGVAPVLVALEVLRAR